MEFILSIVLNHDIIVSIRLDANHFYMTMIKLKRHKLKQKYDFKCTSGTLSI
jgi:hypothetical protein